MNTAIYVLIFVLYYRNFPFSITSLLMLNFILTSITNVQQHVRKNKLDSSDNTFVQIIIYLNAIEDKYIKNIDTGFTNNFIVKYIIDSYVALKKNVIDFVLLSLGLLSDQMMTNTMQMLQNSPNGGQMLFMLQAANMFAPPLPASSKIREALPISGKSDVNLLHDSDEEDEGIIINGNPPLD